MVNNSLVVPSLDVPVPQMVEQLADVLKQFDVQVPEQVIDVPKIYPEDFGTRTFRISLLEPQLAEHLEVLTIVSVSSLRALVEQNEDIPVPRGRGGLVGWQGLQGFSQGQNSAVFLGAEYVDIPDSRGGLQGSRLGQGSPASSSLLTPAGLDGDADVPGEGFFALFSVPKKVRR